MSSSPTSPDVRLEERLKKFSFYAGLSSQAREELLGGTQPVSFADGTRLIEQGGECGALLLVERGGVRVHKDMPSGKGITLYVVVPGEVCVLGVSSMLGGTQYQACASVDTETEALAIPAPIFIKLFGQEAALREFVMAVFSNRLGDFMVLVEDVAFRKMDERLAGFLLEKSAKGDGAYQPVVMTHDQIASYLGTAREVVSRLLHQFVKEGLVTLERGKVLIAAPARLKERTS